MYAAFGRRRFEVATLGLTMTASRTLSSRARLTTGRHGRQSIQAKASIRPAAISKHSHSMRPRRLVCSVGTSTIAGVTFKLSLGTSKCASSSQTSRPCRSRPRRHHPHPRPRPPRHHRRPRPPCHHHRRHRRSPTVRTFGATDRTATLTWPLASTSRFRAPLTATWW